MIDIGAIEKILRVGAEACFEYSQNLEIRIQGSILEQMADEALRIKERRDK